MVISLVVLMAYFGAFIAQLGNGPFASPFTVDAVPFVPASGGSRQTASSAEGIGSSACVARSLGILCVDVERWGGTLHDLLRDDHLLNSFETR